MSPWQPIDADPMSAAMQRVTFVPFFPDGSCAAVLHGDGRWELPSGVLRVGEDVRLGGALRILLETAGFRAQRLHAFARDGGHVAMWSEGDVYRGQRPHAAVPLEVAPPAALARRLRDDDRSDLAELVVRASASRAAADPLLLRAEHVAMLEANYLASETVEGGSGYGGTPDEWRLQREPIVDGIHHDGTFLDLGCANGLLMESVRSWAGERGLDVEPYGVDLAPRLVERARQRLPHWADRIWHGDAVTWTPPGGVRFDFVHSCTGEFARPDDVARLLAFVRPGGRLLYSRYIPSDVRDRTAAQSLQALGFGIAGECRPVLDGRGAPPSTAWIEVPR